VAEVEEGEIGESMGNISKQGGFEKKE